jgi:hypothetical protein
MLRRNRNKRATKVANARMALIMLSVKNFRTHQVVNAALNGLLNDQTEVLADNISGIVKSTLTSDPSRYSALLAG